MKKIKLLILLLTLSLLPMTAQRLFTLEDLNYGGNNYYNLLPKNLYTTWWGDQLMYLDAEEGGKWSPEFRNELFFHRDLKEIFFLNST